MESPIAHRYAEAYFEVARDAAQVEALGKDLERAGAILEDPRVRAALANPRNSVAARTDLAMRLLDGLAEPTRNLARLLLDRRRLPLFGAIVAEYHDIVAEADGVIRAVVSSAVPLDKATEAAVAGALGKRRGQRIQIETVHDPELLGGLVIRMGDEVIDDSVRTHLQQLQAALA
jgi:F-type H+-transporting ATPase subunit delta